MGLEFIVIALVAAIVLALFGANRRGKSEQTTVNNQTDVRLDRDTRRGGSSPLGSLILTIVSLAGGFALSGYLIHNFIEPEVGPVDPWEITAIAMYLVVALVIYGILRLIFRG